MTLVEAALQLLRWDKAARACPADAPRLLLTAPQASERCGPPHIHHDGSVLATRRQ